MTQEQRQEAKTGILLTITCINENLALYPQRHKQVNTEHKKRDVGSEALVVDPSTWKWVHQLGVKRVMHTPPQPSQNPPVRVAALNRDSQGTMWLTCP